MKVVAYRYGKIEMFDDPNVELSEDSEMAYTNSYSLIVALNDDWDAIFTRIEREMDKITRMCVEATSEVPPRVETVVVTESGNELKSWHQPPDPHHNMRQHAITLSQNYDQLFRIRDRLLVERRVAAKYT